MTFNAIVLRIDQERVVSSSVEPVEPSQLPEGEVTVAVEYSTLNYKDGLCLTGGGGLVRNYPHVPGIDFAGTVEASDDVRYQAGDRVVLTGWGVGERWWGGYAQRARVKADWLVPLPEDVSTKDSMAIGTAGFTAMLSVMALEAHGLTPEQGPVLVTGATGGVGSTATVILGNNGYEVAAVTGRPELEPYLRSLGASSVLAREELEAPGKPLESERWAGCVDAVGGAVLARALAQMKYGSSVAAVGLAGGLRLNATVAPFILRGVNLLGIDSVMQPYVNRVAAWTRLAGELPRDRLDAMVEVVPLAAVAQRGPAILKGEVSGRIVVDVNA